MLAKAALMYQNTAFLSRLFTNTHGCTVLSVDCEVVMNYDLEGWYFKIILWVMVVFLSRLTIIQWFLSVNNKIEIWQVLGYLYDYNIMHYWIEIIWFVFQEHHAFILSL